MNAFTLLVMAGGNREPCPSCGEIPRKAPHSKTGMCYPCFLDGGGPGFNFVGGGGYGRRKFHETTTAQVIRENIGDGKNVEYVGRRWV